MKTAKDFEKLPKTDFKVAIGNLVWSANRTMPAYFTSSGEKSKSFCVDFDDIDTKDEYQMASIAYVEVNHYIKPKDNLTTEQLLSVIKCGEDVMISSYIVQKLDKPEIIKNIVAELTEMNKTSWPENFEVTKIFNNKSVKKWFNYCQEYGSNF
jgi:hypothetical protein